MDDTLYDFVSLVLDRYNTKYNDSVVINDIKEWNIHKFLKPECKNVFELATEDLFDTITISEETKSFVSKLRKKHTVYFVTAGHPKTIQARYRLLKRNFPSFKSERLIVCNEKSFLDMHVLIDDCERYFEGYKRYNGFMIAKPWNYKKNMPKDIVRFKKFNEIEGFFDLCEK